MSSTTSKVIVAALVGVSMAVSAGDAFATGRNQYTGRKVDARPVYHGMYGYRYRRHRGIGAGLAAGAALGVAGAAIAGATGGGYYNGYPAYPYGGYRGGYGYDYLPGHGYYGPY